VRTPPSIWTSGSKKIFEASTASGGLSGGDRVVAARLPGSASGRADASRESYPRTNPCFSIAFGGILRAASADSGTPAARAERPDVCRAGGSSVSVFASGGATRAHARPSVTHAERECLARPPGPGDAGSEVAPSAARQGDNDRSRSTFRRRRRRFRTPRAALARTSGFVAAVAGSRHSSRTGGYRGRLCARSARLMQTYTDDVLVCSQTSGSPLVRRRAGHLPTCSSYAPSGSRNIGYRARG